MKQTNKQEKIIYGKRNELEKERIARFDSIRENTQGLIVKDLLLEYS